MASAAEPMSWADTLKSYEAQRAAAPITEKPFYVTNKQKKYEQWVKDPVLQISRDPEVEGTRQLREKESLIRTANRARDRQIQRETPYDILTFQSKREPLEGEPVPVQKERPLRRETTYDIITCQAKPEAEREVPPKPRMLSKNAHVRDFNPITTYYKENHEERQAAEEYERNLKAAQKWEETHVYDPVRARYYDDEAEETFLQTQQEKLLEQTTGTKFRSKLPPAVRHGATMIYDPVSHAVRDPTRIASLEQTKFGRRMMPDVVDTIKERGAVQQDLALTRAVNRIGTDRFDRAAHEFDILSNEQFASVDNPRSPPGPQAARRTQLWDRILHKEADMCAARTTTTSSLPPVAPSPAAAPAAPVTSLPAVAPSPFERVRVSAVPVASLSKPTSRTSTRGSTRTSSRAL